MVPLLGIAVVPTALAQVKIGVIGPLTGPVAPTGIMVRNGVTLATSEINDAGGIRGVGKVEIISEDTRCRPGDAVTAANKLVFRDRVVAVIGDVCSAATIASMKVTERAETPPVDARVLFPCGHRTGEQVDLSGSGCG